MLTLELFAAKHINEPIYASLCDVMRSTRLEDAPEGTFGKLCILASLGSIPNKMLPIAFKCFFLLLSLSQILSPKVKEGHRSVYKIAPTSPHIVFSNVTASLNSIASAVRFFFCQLPPHPK